MQIVNRLSHAERNLRDVMVIVIAMALISCHSNQHLQSSKKNLSTFQDSLVLDRDGNKYIAKLFLDGNIWITDNLKLKIQGSYTYPNEENADRYGRLYTWESAKRGCTFLGKDWRLPSLVEWQRLTGLYGPDAKDSVEMRKKAFHALLYTGNVQFNALLGGGRDLAGEFARIDAHGFYWTSTESDEQTAWFANFAKGSQALYLQNDGEKLRGFSVRCLKSLGTLR